MRTEVLVAMVMSGGSLLGVIVTGVFSWLAQHRAAEAKSHAEAAAQGVTNSHSKNLRDDLDDRFDDLDEKVDQAITVSQEALRISAHATTLVDGVQSDIRGLRRDIGRATNLSLDAIGHPVN